jgi:hypothetical protein
VTTQSSKLCCIITKEKKNRRDKKESVKRREKGWLHWKPIMTCGFGFMCFVWLVEELLLQSVESDYPRRHGWSLHQPWGRSTACHHNLPAAVMAVLFFFCCCCRCRRKTRMSTIYGDILHVWSKCKYVLVMACSLASNPKCYM